MPNSIDLDDLVPETVPIMKAMEQHARNHSEDEATRQLRWYNKRKKYKAMNNGLIGIYLYRPNLKVYATWNQKSLGIRETFKEAAALYDAHCLATVGEKYAVLNDSRAIKKADLHLAKLKQEKAERLRQKTASA